MEEAPVTSQRSLSGLSAEAPSHAVPWQLATERRYPRDVSWRKPDILTTRFIIGVLPRDLNLARQI